MNYYNEWDAYCADWLRNLIAEGLIPPGDVDERSITEVQASDLAGYTQCHFFAGVAGWSYALELAGWPADRPVWTGSCPCQPFSAAGKRQGADDERHLWPEFLRLIAQCRPATVLGEQVASKLGRGWLAGVRADLEELGYAVGAADLCAAGVSAPHIRQRLWWVADAQRGTAERQRQQVAGTASGVQGAAREQRVWPDAGHGGHAGGLGDTSGPRLAQRERNGRVQRGAVGSYEGQATERPGSPWEDAVWISCGDGKARRIESGLEPLVTGSAFKLADGRTGETQSRAEILKGLGNAIVPQVGAVFIRAAMT